MFIQYLVVNQILKHRHLLMLSIFPCDAYPGLDGSQLNVLEDFLLSN